MVVADGLVPIWHQAISNHRDDASCLMRLWSAPALWPRHRYVGEGGVTSNKKNALEQKS